MAEKGGRAGPRSGRPHCRSADNKNRDSLSDDRRSRFAYGFSKGILALEESVCGLLTDGSWPEQVDALVETVESAASAKT
jgi:hypothetical protein